MKRLMMTLIGLTAVLFNVGIKSPRTPELKASGVVAGNRQEPPPSPLTKAEEDDLQRQIGQTLAWIAVWNPRGAGCTNDGKEMVKLLKRYRGRKIEVGLSVTETNLGLNIDPFHVYWGVRRFHDQGLGPSSPGYFCENSYQSYVETFKRRMEEARAAQEEATRRAEADPQMAESLKRDREIQAQIPMGRVERQEARSYIVPPFVERPATPPGSWNGEKNHLYERILAAVRKEVEDFDCAPGQIVKITVPDFEVDDPATFVLVEAPKPDGRSVVIVDFDRNYSSGKRDALFVKSCSLGRPGYVVDENVLRLRDTINRKKVKIEMIKCP